MRVPTLGPPTVFQRAVAHLERGLAHGSMPIVAALLAVALLLPALGDGFQLDDWFQRLRLLGYGDAPAIQLFVFYDGDPDAIHASMEGGFLPWWTAPRLKHSSLRYLSVLTMQLDYLLWPDRPELMRLHSFLWLAAMVAAAALLYGRILGAGWIAGLAALLYAVDDAHAPPAVYLANRNAVIATCFGVLCLLCHTRWREQGWRAGAWLAPLFLAAALAAGEIALATAGYLFAYALFLEARRRDRGLERDSDARGALSRAAAGAWERLRTLVPCSVALAAWAVAYRAGGFGTSGSGFYTDPVREPTAYLAALARRAPVLLLGQWTPIPSDYGSVFAPGTPAAARLWCAGVGVAAILALLLYPLLRRDRAARFWALGALLSLLPIAAVGPQDRLLFFVGLGSMALLAQLAGALLGRTLELSRFARAAALAATGLLLAIHLLLAPVMTSIMLGVQREASARMLSAIESVPQDASIAEQDLVLINAPDQVYAVAAIPAVKGLAGQPVPRRLRSLANGATPMEITRVDDRTLSLALDRGLFPTPFSRYYRSADLPLSPGDRVTLGGLEVEIARVDPNGDPVEIVCRFEAPLEDASLRWLRWDGKRYVPWSPPPLGASERVEAEPGIFG